MREQVKISREKQNLIKSFENMINNKSYELGLMENTLNKINPNSILEKGYAKVEQNNKNITLKKDLIDDEFQIIFKDGKIQAKQVKGEKNEN